MNNKDKTFQAIKRNNGEAAAKAVRDYVPNALECDEVIFTLKHAGGYSSEFQEQVIPVLASLFNEQDTHNKEVEPMEVLLEKAGYNWEVTTTKSEFAKYKKFYRKGELLCSFNQIESRLKSFHCIWLVHKNIDTILPSSKPKREDEYGTSVMCIQISKDGNFISIKNRYNHSVSNADNTHKSNPDNIINGLTSAICKKLNITIKTRVQSLDSYVRVGKQIIKINREVDGVYFGDKCYVKEGTLVELDPSHEIILDYFIYSSKRKEVSTPTSIEDSFIVVANQAIKRGDFIIKVTQ